MTHKIVAPKKENSLSVRNPELAKEWNYIMNEGMSPDDFSYASNKKVWWICKKGHEWKAAINARTGRSHSGCPVCSNRVVLKGYNDLESNNPVLAAEWDYSKNIGITPDKISATSSKKFWWICDKGHSFESTVYNRNIKKQGCPYCSNQKFKPEYNSLYVLRPDLAEEWDYEMNYPLTPRDVLCGGDKEYWWKCKKTPHSFKQNIGSRVQINSQCPYCSSQKLLKGFNDLATKNPEAALLWDAEKNGDLTPSDVMNQSNKKVWWKCPDCGHSWKSGINNVAGSGTRCPKCSETYKVSEAEQIIYYYLSKFFSDAVMTYKPSWLVRGEIDIFVPSIDLAIEYDGEFWHKKTNQRDIEKTKKIFEHGLWLIRMREEKLPPIEDGSSCIFVPTQKYDYDRLSIPIKKLFEMINEVAGTSIVPDIDVERDWKSILSTAKTVKKERSIVRTHPKISKMWNYEKNDGLKPDQVFAGSNKKVWWKCPDCGYEWEAIVVNMTKRDSECPACRIRKEQELKELFNDPTGDFINCNHKYNSHRMIQGINDLNTIRPDIAAEWNYEKNGVLKPDDFSAGSSRRVWWKCPKCGTEWKTAISNRTYGYGCPKCGKEKAAARLSESSLKPGVNDLETVNPIVASQWDYEKNGGVLPSEVNAESNKVAWWKCKKCGNEWKASIVSRKKATDCPYCINRRFMPGFNDIFTKRPDLAEEWDYEKNNEVDPEKTICTSQKKVWWKCKDCGCEWKTSIYLRFRGSGCPKCTHAEGMRNRTKKLVKEGNSFENAFPEIAKEWNYEKNEGITPSDITAHNGKKYWWKCPVCGYEWQATPNHRAQGTGCPKCRDKNNAMKKAKKVRNVNTGEIFESISEAARACSVSLAAISRVCNGESEKTKGIKWEFVEE